MDETLRNAMEEYMKYSDGVSKSDSFKVAKKPAESGASHQSRLVKPRHVVGIDEVGRGAWAGPLLVVAAKAKTALPVGLKDSKVLTKKRRETLFPLLEESCDFGEGWVEPAEIDQIGLTGAMELAVRRALIHLKAENTDEIIMDGTINYCDKKFMNVQCIARADATRPIVSAASIYAKVLRDRKMEQLAVEHPGYGFGKHVGYGTKLHLERLKSHGVSPIHRLSYKTVAVFV